MSKNYSGNITNTQTYKTAEDAFLDRKGQTMSNTHVSYRVHQPFRLNVTLFILSLCYKRPHQIYPTAVVWTGWCVSFVSHSRVAAPC